jgi:hypothetical protein
MEKIFGEIFRSPLIKKLTTEYVDECSISDFVQMNGNGRSFYELDHGIPFEFPFSKTFYKRLPIWFHLNFSTKLFAKFSEKVFVH